MSKDTAARTKSRATTREKAKGNGKRGNGHVPEAAVSRMSEKVTTARKANSRPAAKTAAKVLATSARDTSARDGKGRGSGGALKAAAIGRFDETFAAEPRNRLALNAVTAGKVQVVARNREAVVRAAQRSFSHVIKTPEITNQKQSGRCWMFAGLNVLRVAAMKRLKVDSSSSRRPTCSSATSSRRPTTSSRR